MPTFQNHEAADTKATLGREVTPVFEDMARAVLLTYRTVSFPALCTEGIMTPEVLADSIALCASTRIKGLGTRYPIVDLLPHGWPGAR